MAKMNWLKIEVSSDHPLADLAIAAPLDPLDLAAVEVPGVGDIHFPDFSNFPTALAKARQALFMAAGIEHALLVQYLYSAYSLTGSDATIRNARAALVNTAVEEMAHLMTVQNLLLLIRGEASVKRTDRQSEEAEGGDFDAPVVPFNLMFEPFSKQSLAKYIVAEAPHGAADVVQPAGLYERIENLAKQGHMGDFQQVGTLYLLMGVLFGNEQTLKDKADEEDDESGWYARVKALADFIVDNVPQFGGRDGIHLRDDDFATLANGEEFLNRQSQDINWDRSVSSADFRVDAPTTRDEALDALEFISRQGEAATGPAADESHFHRFVEAFKAVYGEAGSNPEPTDGIAKVPSGPAIPVVIDGTAADPAIDHPKSAQWARLADLRYAILLGALEEYLRSSPDDRRFLEGWCFSEMFHLKKLGEFLTSKPRKPDGGASAGVAAVPFNLPERFVADQAMPLTADQLAQWPEVIAEWFTEAVQIETSLLSQSDASDAEQQFLNYMREVDGRKLQEATIRQKGSTQRTTWDQVREIMEWGAGSGNPFHGGNRRFWNRPLQEFKDDPSFNPAGALAQVEGGQMPANRDMLQPEQVTAIKSWVDGGCLADQPVTSNVHPVRKIQELRILPPLAIGRLGSSGVTDGSPYPDPMDNYQIGDPDQPGGFRKLIPSETLTVNTATGEITSADVPDGELPRFRGEDERIRPVAPFLEVWARFDERPNLEPLTTRHLQQLGLTPQDVMWSVEAGNLKAFRRTGDTGDRIEASIHAFSDHNLKRLRGRAANFLTDESIPMGWVQYIKPTDADGAFPEIRLRFTPAEGKIFGHRQDFPGQVVVYDSNRGMWDGHTEQVRPNLAEPRSRFFTSPANIYARDAQNRSLGYLDDTCDGIVRVEIAGKTAIARFSSGPPDFAPDSLHVRTVQDELNQMTKGPIVEDEDLTEDELINEVQDIMQRALETVRLMDAAAQGRRFGSPFPPAQVTFTHVTGRHTSIRQALEGLRAPAGTPERNGAVGALTLMNSILRRYTDAGDSSPSATRRMPAFMRGADAGRLALTRRQFNIVRRAMEHFTPTSSGTPQEAMIRMIETLGRPNAILHTAFELNGTSLRDRFESDPQEVIEYLLQKTAEGSQAQQFGVDGDDLIVPGDPDASAFIQLIENPSHFMHDRFVSYQDGSNNGIDVARLWIQDLS